jgi:hypothetical protein
MFREGSQPHVNMREDSDALRKSAHYWPSVWQTAGLRKFGFGVQVVI